MQAMLAELEIPDRVNHVFCFSCHNAYPNPRGYDFPNRCAVCGIDFDERGQYCLPDHIIQNGDSRGVLYVNDEYLHSKDKVKRKDRMQVREFRAEGWPVFVLNNAEVDNMTNATLKAYLYALWRAVANPDLYQRFYAGEKEYPALQ